MAISGDMVPAGVANVFFEGISVICILLLTGLLCGPTDRDKKNKQLTKQGKAVEIKIGCMDDENNFNCSVKEAE